MDVDCEDLGLPNQWELPRLKPAPDPSWAQHAACIGKPPDWWYPTDGRRTPEVLQALAICDRCPVQDECLRHAIRTNETDGIWGGRSERQRRRIRSATRGAA